MAAAKDGVKVQLNLKAGNDLLNIYAVNARELDALVEEIVEVSPAIAARFGLRKSGAGGSADQATRTAVTPSPAPAAEADEKPSQAASGDTAAPDAASAPTSTEGEALSPREKARLRLKGAK